MGVCFECNEPAEENHHVVPEILGGTKTIPLCSHCHGKVHDQRRLSISALTRAALQKLKDAGVKLGCPRKYNDKIVKKMLRLAEKKITYAEIGRRLNIPSETVISIVKRELCKNQP